jgi:hypothetical protein
MSEVVLTVTVSAANDSSSGIVKSRKKINIIDVITILLFFILIPPNIFPKLIV